MATTIDQLKSLFQKAKKKTLDATTIDEKIGQSFNNFKQQQAQASTNRTRFSNDVSEFGRGVGTVASNARDTASQGLKWVGEGWGTVVRAPVDMAFNKVNNATDERLANTLRSQQQRLIASGNQEAARNRAQLIGEAGQRQADRQISFGQNTRDVRNRTLMGAGQVALSALGVGAGAPALLGTAAIGGGLGYGITKLTGGSNQQALEALGKGIGNAPQYAGINKITQPGVDKLLGYAKPEVMKVIDPIARAGYVATSAFVNGLANLLEDEGLTRVGEGRKSTTGERLTSLGVGAVLGTATSSLQLRGLLKQLKDNKATIAADGFIRNKTGQLYDPATGKWVKETASKAIEGIKTKQKQLVEFVGGNKYDPNDFTLNNRPDGSGMDLQPKAQSRLKTNPQAGFVDPQGMFQAPYKRGDISALNKRIDDLIGYSAGEGSYKKDFAVRQSMISNYLGDPSAPPEFKKELQNAVDQVDFAQDAKLNPQASQPTKGVEAQIDRTQLTGRQLDVPNQTLLNTKPIAQGIQQPTITPSTTSVLPLKPGLVPIRTQVTQPQTPRVKLINQPQSQTLQVQDSRVVGGVQNQTSESIIQQAKKEIGKLPDEPKRSVKQVFDDLYTQWVNRYAPIERLAEKAKGQLKIKGAELRPEADPTYALRRLTGAGGIADTRFQTEFKPVISQMDKLGIPKDNMDIYLKARRDIGLSERGIKGSDKQIAQQRIMAIEQKHPQIREFSQQLYDYQNRGFQEMIDAGFLSPESANLIRQQNPDYVPFQRVMDQMDEYLGLPTRKTMQGSQPVLKIKGSDKQVYSPLESIIANTFKQRGAIEKNNVAKSIVNLQKVADLGIEKVSKSGTGTITVWNNGQKEFYRVGEDIAETAKGLNEENTNTLLKIFQAPAALLRQGATGRNPDFMIPNIVRDQMDAAITSKYGYIPLVDYFSGLKSMLKNDEIYNKWKNSGAMIDLGEMSGRKSIQASFDQAKAKKSLFSWLGDKLDTMGKYSEQPTRVGLFKKAYQKTGNVNIAMMESRDATVDFARMGSKMKTANSIIPFLNVGVQGFDKLIRSAKNNPGKLALNMTVYGVLPSASITAFNLLNHPEEYSEIPQYEKDANFVFVNGRNEDGTVNYWTIPKGNILPLVANPTENLLTFMYGENQQSFGEFATQFVSSALPVVGDGQSLKEVALKTIGSNLPQMIKPVTENLLNKSFYKYNTESEDSKEIVPYYLKKKKPFEQSYEWTPTTYKAIGSVLNVSPLQVQNLMEGYLAGYAKVPSNIVDSLKKISDGEPVDNNTIPIIRRFIKTTYPSSGTKKVEPKKEKTSLMDRVTGKADASTGSQEKLSVNIPTDQKTFNDLYKKALSGGQGFLEEKQMIELDPTLDDAKKQEKIAELQTKKVAWSELLIKMQDKHPEQVFEAELSTYGKGSTAGVENRASWTVKKLEGLEGEERQKLINRLWDEGVITSKSNGVAQYIEDEYGIDVWKYTGSDKKGSKGKKGKKLKIKTGSTPTFKKVSIKAPQAPQMAKINFNIPTAPRVPVRKTSTTRPRINLNTASKQLLSVVR